jgi:4-hydroxybenzoate polyprenyltransferase
MKVLHTINTVIQRVENSETPFTYYVLTFFFAVTLRNFFETFSDNIYISFEFYSHYYAFYICLACALIILFHYAVKEKIKKVAQVILPSFLILVIAPLIDLFLRLKSEFDMAYMLPGYHENILFRFFTFFGPLDTSGITPGMRIEIAIVIVGSFIYCFIKMKRVLKSLICSFLVYTVIFVFCAMPFVTESLFQVIRLDYTLSSLSMRNFYLFVIALLVMWIFYVYNRKYFAATFKDVRLFRLLHFELMAVLGIVLAYRAYPLSFQVTHSTVLHILFLMIAIGCAWIFSVMTNNVADYGIDTITNVKRPLPSLTIPLKEYKQLSWIFFLFTLVYAAAINFETLFLILVFTGNYFIYSMPPLRIKRIPFFSKVIISLNSLVLVMAGYLFVAPQLDIPVYIVVYFLVCLTAVANFIDIKDYKGDKKMGIKTLPTLLGLKKSKIVIGSFFLGAYPLVYCMVGDVLLLVPSLLLGVIQFFLVTKKEYREEFVFMVYVYSVVMLLVYLSIFQ